MLKHVITNCLIIFASLTYAQANKRYKVSGTVVSFYTKKPIPYGFVHFHKDGKTKSTISDSLGHFVMTGLSKGVYTLSFEIMKGFYYKKKDTTLSIGNDIKNFRYSAHIACADEYSVQNALQDIKKNAPKIILVSHGASKETLRPIVFTAGDQEFQNKYGIVYSDKSFKTGYEECMLPYNLKIFDYLDKKFGTVWRREVRKEAVGLEAK